jgi:hydroxymethylpyrimidine/phosphomethylpyrimidine kinase
MHNERPYVLSIAGFDPSAGAGLLADCKTFEQHKVYGFGVCSALTIQNDDQFFNVQWLSVTQIIEQIQPLTTKFNINACKIGIISSLDTLQEVTRFLKQHNPNIQIIWDPVLKASAGYTFHHDIQAQQLEQVLMSINLVTPNYNELQQLQNHMKSPLIKNDHATFCPILLKGGHRPDRPGVDTLYESDGHKMIEFGVEKISPKHGSGCVLSAAVTAELAKGNSLQQACRKAKQYIETFLNSNHSLLGYHNIC